MTGGRIAPSEAAGHQDRDSAVFQAAVTQGEAAALEEEAHHAGGKRNAGLKQQENAILQLECHCRHTHFPTATKR